jgi:hypothetical protein
MKKLLATLGFVLSTWAGLGAQTAGESAPTPSFDLLGNVSQKVTWSSTSWDTGATSAWSFTSSLRPKWIDGPMTVVADSVWTLPMTASLASVAPTVSVPEAYFRVTVADGLDLTFGQKRYALGVGQTFTVGDSVNPVVGFLDQKTGFRGATVDWSPASWASVSAAVSTESGVADDLAGAGQVSLLWQGLQVTTSLVARRDKSFNPALGVSAEVLGVVLTAEGATEFSPQGVRPAGAYATWKAPDAWSSPAVSGSAGARWNQSWGDWDVTLAAEALHWAQGWSADETQAWKDAVALSPSPVLSALRTALPLRGQDNGFFRFAVGWAGVALVSGFAAVDLTDHSALLQGTAQATLWDNLDLTMTLQTNTGTSDDAWGSVATVAAHYQLSFATTYHF